jgi:hypothetical protein
MMLPLIWFPLLLAAGLQAPERPMYVVDLEGSWRDSSGAPLKKGSPLAASALLKPPVSAGPGDFIVIRDGRTMGAARLHCDQGQCNGATRVNTMRWSSSARLARLQRADPSRVVKALGAVDLRRVRVAGARADDRELGLVVLPIAGDSLDISALVGRHANPAKQLVARFCALTGTSDDAAESCLEDRDIKPGDCPVTGRSRCALPSGVRAVRVDLYEKERTMLSTVAAASGFAVLVPPAEVAVVRSAAGHLLAALNDARPDLGAEEYQALLAAAALSLAGVK